MKTGPMAGIMRLTLSKLSKPSNFKSAASFGFRISRFELNYGSERYSLAGSSNLISVAINLSDGYHRSVAPAEEPVK